MVARRQRLELRPSNAQKTAMPSMNWAGLTTGITFQPDQVDPNEPQQQAKHPARKGRHEPLQNQQDPTQSETQQGRSQQQLGPALAPNQTGR